MKSFAKFLSLVAVSAIVGAGAGYWASREAANQSSVPGANAPGAKAPISLATYSGQAALQGIAPVDFTQAAGDRLRRHHRLCGALRHGHPKQHHPSGSDPAASGKREDTV